jgi:hypothetical protein
LAHLKNVWEYSKKYQYLLTPEAKRVCFEQNIDPVRFTFCWCHKETHYNPDKDFYNSNRTVDHNITQVNDCEWDLLYKQLPKDLLKRTNPKHDSEIGIAMLYLWINDRTKNRWCWCYLNDEAWTLYWRIGELKKCMQN